MFPVDLCEFGEIFLVERHHFHLDLHVARSSGKLRVLVTGDQPDKRIADLLELRLPLLFRGLEARGDRPLGTLVKQAFDDGILLTPF